MPRLGWRESWARFINWLIQQIFTKCPPTALEPDSSNCRSQALSGCHWLDGFYFSVNTRQQCLLHDSLRGWGHFRAAYSLKGMISQSVFFLDPTAILCHFCKKFCYSDTVSYTDTTWWNIGKIRNTWWLKNPKWTLCCFSAANLPPNRWYPS